MTRQLPCAANDCGVVVYRVRYKKKRTRDGGTTTDDGSDAEEVSKLEKVRRETVRDYLNFFSEHHKYFQRGLIAKDGETLLPPIEVCDELIDALPDNGRPDGLVIKYIDDEVVDDDGVRDGDHEHNGTSENGHPACRIPDVNSPRPIRSC